MANLVPHKHCIVCGQAISGEESFCDDLCQLKYRSVKRRQQMLFIAFMVVFIMMLVVPAIIELRG